MLLNIDPTPFAENFFPAIQESLHWFAPEFQLAITAVAVLILDLFLPKRASKHLAWVAIAGCVYATSSLFAITAHGDETRPLFLGMIAIDSYANFFKLFFLLGAIPFLLISLVSKELENIRLGEYYAILLAATLGGILMASSNHLLMAFMSLELLSLSSYVLVGYHKRSEASSEASLKYIIYGGVASAMMGFGLSLLYGLSGSGEIPKVLATVQAEGADLTVIVALLLTFLGLAYKMATIPMHFWSPDVYEGAPTPVTAFLSVASKAAGFALCMRMFGLIHIPEETYGKAAQAWAALMMVVAMVTMTLGNFAALWQNNVKRLFAYSSIAHAGFMMMGVALLELPGASGTHVGIQSVAFYLLAYLAMNVGTFAIIVLIENRTGSVDIAEYSGLGWRAPFLGFSLVIFLFSLVGIPPTAGFSGKFQVFMDVVNSAKLEQVPGGLRVLLFVMAAVALVNTAVSVYYYARIIKAMYLEKMEEGAERLRFPLLGKLVVLAMLILTFYLFFSASSIIQSAREMTIFAGA